MKSSTEGAVGAKHGGSKIVVQMLTALFIIASFGYLFVGIIHYLGKLRA